ncbi:MAG: APC family permease [Nakamurella sp.]
MGTTVVESPPPLSTVHATALYVGALLGPAALLLPGLAVDLAGPASVISWGILLMLSALLAIVFAGLGRRFGSQAGVRAFTAERLGATAGRVVAHCFLGGVIIGAPLVCLIGGQYLAAPFGGSTPVVAGCAAVLLLLVLLVTLAGARAGTPLQLTLVILLIVLIGVAVLGSAIHADNAHWAPFAPHGAGGITSAAASLMLAFVGWEASASLTGRLRDARRQLPRVVTAAFIITSVVYLGLATSTVAVLGASTGTRTPLSDLLAAAVGPPGRILAALCAVALTLACTNAYLTGAAALIRTSTAIPRPSRRTPTRRHGLELAVGVSGFLVIGGVGIGWWTVDDLVAIPSTLFVAVYLGCTVSATLMTKSWLRAVSATAATASLALLTAGGWTVLVPVAIASATRIWTSNQSPAPTQRTPTGYGATRRWQC